MSFLETCLSESQAEAAMDDLLDILVDIEKEHKNHLKDVGELRQVLDQVDGALSFKGLRTCQEDVETFIREDLPTLSPNDSFDVQFPLFSVWDSDYDEPSFLELHLFVGYHGTPTESSTYIFGLDLDYRVDEEDEGVDAMDAEPEDTRTFHQKNRPFDIGTGEET